MTTWFRPLKRTALVSPLYWEYAIKDPEERMKKVLNLVIPDKSIAGKLPMNKH